MSRREDRDSHAKRSHSRSERDPSPKKSRKDGKQATERTYSSSHVDNVTMDLDRKQRRGLRDALPLDVPPAVETKGRPASISEGLDKRDGGLPGDMKRSTDPKELPRSRNYFQHDERGSAGHGGRSSATRERAIDHRRWSNSKEQARDGYREKTERGADEKKVWRHDCFFELETEAPQARKRPAFREKKVEAPPETAAAANESDPRRLPTTRREERGQYSRESESKPYNYKPRADERDFRRGDRAIQRDEERQRGGYQPRERFGGGAPRGRDRFNSQYGERNTQRAGGFQAEKWKHDLFDEANKSPPPKNEEEQIAKVEALLAL